jgi:hypothetical protein
VADKRETALERWSRLKRSGPDSAAEPLPKDELALARQDSADGKVAKHADDGDAEETSGNEEAQPSVDLPDIDSLNGHSDYSVFLREGVSEEIRRKALRVLWRSDPILANLDGLNDYDEDFAAVSHVAEALRTAYQVGKGYLQDQESTQPAEDVVAKVEIDDSGADGTVPTEPAEHAGEMDETELKPENDRGKSETPNDRTGVADESAEKNNK